MRHGDKVNNLGRKSAHRKAMLANMASSLILHKRITTTVAKLRFLNKDNIFITNLDIIQTRMPWRNYRQI